MKLLRSDLPRPLTLCTSLRRRQSAPTNRLSAVCLLVAAVVALACLAHAQQQQPPQNVLVVIADDVGVDAIGCYASGSSPPPTPNIDALAARGVRNDAHPCLSDLFADARQHPDRALSVPHRHRQSDRPDGTGSRSDRDPAARSAT